MEEYNLEAHLRQEIGSNKSKSLRKNDFIPAVIYGKEEKNLLLKIKRPLLSNLFKTLPGLNAVVNLSWNENENAVTTPVLIQSLQRDPLTDKVLHIDFRRIILTEEIETKIPLVFTGEAPGIKMGGIVLRGLSELAVKCLPTDIPSEIEVDISSLELGKTIHVSELVIPPKATVLTSAEEIVASCIMPKAEEEKVEAVPEAAAPEEAKAEAAPAEAQPQTQTAAKEKTKETEKTEKTKE